MNRKYCYKDVSLVPRYSELETRSKADVSFKFVTRGFTKSFKFNSVAIPANMKCTIDTELAISLAEAGYFYVMHRFGDTYSFVKQMRELDLPISISVGVHDFDLIKKLRLDDDIFITVDVAHGHHKLVGDTIKFIRDEVPNAIIIAGNIATPEGAEFLAKASADFVKVGIGQGRACTTKDQTGFTMPMYSCIRDIYEQYPDIKIIADGGVRCNGDIAKAINAGARAVMIGSIFAACNNSPGKYISKDGALYKEYYGSASFFNKGYNKNIEGTSVELPCNGMDYMEKLEEINESLQSAVSYAGGTKIFDLKSANYCIIN